MPSIPVLRSLSSALLATSLMVACSASPDAARVETSGEAMTDDAGPPCSAYDPCASGYYCAPADTANVCGWGTCAVSPRACPMIFEPVCGCDGNTYLNACWATMSVNGQPGTTSSGKLSVTPTLSALAGAWWGQSGYGRSMTAEMLVLRSDSTYSLTEWTGFDRRPSESAGTFTTSFMGIVLRPGDPSNGSTPAGDFYLENTCPIGGPLRLVSAQPTGSGESMTLTQE